MDKAESARIFRMIITGYVLPPVVWFFLVWFLDIADFDDLLSMWINIQGPLILALMVTFIGYQASRFLHQIVDAKSNPGNIDKVEKAQSAISRLPRYFIYSFPIVAFLTPLAMVSGVFNYFSTNFFYSIFLYFFVAFVLSASFLIQMVIGIEKWTSSIPLSQKFNDLNVANKFNIILGPQFISVFAITAISAFSVVYNNRDSDETHYLMLVKSLTVGAVLMSIVFVNLYSMQNMLLNPVRNLHGTMRNLVRGKLNLAARLEYTTRDELAFTAKFFNDFMSSIMETMKNIQRSSYDMEDFTQKLDLNSKKYRYIAQKEDDAISDIARNLNFVHTSMTELSETTASQGQKLDVVIEEMKKAADYGVELLHELENSNEEVIKTTTVAQAGESSMNMMRNTMEKIHNVFIEISEVLTFINDVAEKINLLSLNASIEAARAGDLGMGFSVVAQQIARLAEETKKSVSNINQLLEQSDDTIKAGSDQILSGAHTVLTLLDGVDNIEKLFGKLLFSLKEELALFNKVEVNISDIKMDSTSLERLSQGFKERVFTMQDNLSNITDYSKNTLEATSELTNNALSNRKIVSQLKKRVTFFQMEKTKTKPIQLNPKERKDQKGQRAASPGSSSAPSQVSSQASPSEKKVS